MPHGNIGWAVHQGWGEGWARPPEQVLWMNLAANQTIASGAFTAMGSLGAWNEVYKSPGWGESGVGGDIALPEGITHFQVRCSAWISSVAAGGDIQLWMEIHLGSPVSFGPSSGTIIMPTVSTESHTRASGAARSFMLDTGIVEAPQGGSPENRFHIHWQNQTSGNASIFFGNNSWLQAAGWNLG